MTEKFLAPWYLNTSFLIVFVFLLALSIYLIAIFVDRKRNDYSLTATLTFLGIGIIILSLGFQLYLLDKEKVRWTKDYVIPYIDSLPVEKSGVINRLNIKSSTNIDLIFNVNGELVEYERPFKGETFEFMKKLDLKFTLKPNEEPYVEYKYLENPIEWYQSGYYDLVLYLPKDFNW